MCAFCAFFGVPKKGVYLITNWGGTFLRGQEGCLLGSKQVDTFLLAQESIQRMALPCVVSHDWRAVHKYAQKYFLGFHRQGVFVLLYVFTALVLTCCTQKRVDQKGKIADKS